MSSLFIYHKIRVSCDKAQLCSCFYSSNIMSELANCFVNDDGTCADSEGGEEGVWTPPPPQNTHTHTHTHMKHHKNIGFLSNTGQDPLKKSQSYTKPSFFVGPSSTRQLNAIRWLPPNSGIRIFPPLVNYTKKLSKLDPL